MFGMMSWNTAFGVTQSAVLPTSKTAVTITVPSRPTPRRLRFPNALEGAEAPCALIQQLEYIAEDNPGEYRHVKEVRIAEWPVEFLRRPRRTHNTIPDFSAPNAPANRLDILRGLANQK